MGLKAQLISVAIILGSINSVLSEDERRYITFIDEKNSSRLIDLKDKPDYQLLQQPRDFKEDKNKYLLFTKKNPSSPYILNPDVIPESSGYNAKVPTVVLVHGWEGDQNSPINILIRQVYLDKSDVNFIVVDWSYLAKSNYVTATLGVPSVGHALARLLTALYNQRGMSYDDVHLIGFSLGAHVVGVAGRQLDGKLARITGLDPAGPGWVLNSNRLQSSDAVYVEGIHTDQRIFGTMHTVGHTDFYPNGGLSQPGCPKGPIISNSCSHNRAWELFASTVQYNKLVGRKCKNIISVETDLCFGESLNMGNDDMRKTGEGLYRLDTTKIYPYF